VTPSLLDDKAPALSDCQGCDITWRESKDLTVTEVKKKQKAKSGRNKGQVRTVTKSVPRPSFFHYFGAPMTDEEEAEFEEGADEDTEQVKLSMEEDYDIGHSIRTSLIPEAVLWYTGEAIEEDEDDEEDYEEEGSEDEDEEDEDEEEEEEEEPKKGKGKKGGKSKAANSKLTFSQEGGFAASGGAPAGGEQPECKQN
jgi:nucleosome assembly protein 1-like 1